MEIIPHYNFEGKNYSVNSVSYVSAWRIQQIFDFALMMPLILSNCKHSLITTIFFTLIYFVKRAADQIRSTFISYDNIMITMHDLFPT